MRYDSIVDMRYPKRFTCLIFVFAAPLCLAADVLIDVRDTNGKPASDAVVWAIPTDRSVAAATRATAVMDQKNRAFIPHVLAVQVGTSVTFPNSDNVRHQVYSFSPAKSFQLPLYIGTPANPIVFDKPGVVSLGCNIHDQMSAFIVVVGTPYFAKSGKSGRGVLRNLEDGHYEVQMWHPRMGQPFTAVPVTVEGQTKRELTIVFRKK